MTSGAIEDRFLGGSVIANNLYIRQFNELPSAAPLCFEQRDGRSQADLLRVLRVGEQHQVLEDNFFAPIPAGLWARELLPGDHPVGQGQPRVMDGEDLGDHPQAQDDPGNPAHHRQHPIKPRAIHFSLPAIN